ncbi:aromatic acid exporter family protein [Blastococcus sp. SYSU DS0552]
MQHSSSRSGDGSGHRRSWWGSARRTWARHPRIGLAVRAAVAATLAWWLALLVPGPLSDYPYYAPLGAVIATTASTLAGSVRSSVQTVAAIALGAGVALVGDVLIGQRLVTLAVVIAVSVVLSGWEWLGSASSWLSTAALFILLFGNENTTAYVLGYLGLTFMGALVGLAVTAAFPPLPLAPAEQSLATLRDALAGQLDDLVDGLRQDHPPTQDEWRGRIRTLDPLLAHMRDAVRQTDEARRGNRRATRYREAADRQYRQARALERLTLLVEDLTQLIAETELADRETVPLGPRLRPAASRALAALADVLRSVGGATADPEAVRRADAALAEFTTELRRARATTDDDLLDAGNIAGAVRRSLESVRPAGDA